MNDEDQDEEFVVIQVSSDPLSDKKVRLMSPRREDVRSPVEPTRA